MLVSGLVLFVVPVPLTFYLLQFSTTFLCKATRILPFSITPMKATGKAPIWEKCSFSTEIPGGENNSHNLHNSGMAALCLLGGGPAFAYIHFF